VSQSNDLLAEVFSMLSDLKKEVAILRQSRTVKDAYSIREAADMTKHQGARSYPPWTLRDACRTGRWPGAYKPHPRQGWRIPHDALRRILVDGLPIEKA